MAVLWFSGPAAADAQEKVTYTDHMLPIIEQHCANCHNPDKKKGDLVLTSYTALLKGGGSGAVVVSGNVDGSKIWKAVTHAEDPTMPPNKPKLADKELDVFRKWIAGGLLEASGSKAVVAARSSIDLTMKTSTTGRPDGPPPMPRELPLDPVVHTKRGAPITGLAASPWAPLVAIAGQKQVLLYNTTNLDLLGILPFSEGQPWDLKFSRSGKLLLAAGGHGAKSGRVIVWNIESGERVATIGEEYDTVLAADISPDQSLVALGGPSRLVKIHSTKTGEVEHKMKKHTDWVTAVAFSPNGEFLATGDRNGGVVIWAADNGQELFTTPGHKGAVTALSWRDDSRLVASSSEDGSVKLWESGEGRQAKTWVAHSNGALGVAYGHDGKLVTCGRDGALTMWSGDGTKLKACEFSGEPAVRAVLTHDGARVVAADFSGRVGVWSAADGRKIAELDANPPLLAEQIVAAQMAVEELQARADKPTPLTTANKSAANTRDELPEARAALEKLQGDFLLKAREVTRLKELAKTPNPPADLEQQLSIARAAREQYRAATNAATLSLEARAKQADGFKHQAPAVVRAADPAAELAIARERLARLTRAQAQGVVFRAKEGVAAKKRELDALRTALAARQEDLKKLNKDLDAARDSAGRTKVKADIKTATLGIKETEAAIKKCGGELAALQNRVEKTASSGAPGGGGVLIRN
jgi:mono/diheme cytochrome c family protein